MKYLIVILTLTLFLIGGIFLPRDFRADEEVIFKVERGDGSREIALNLEKEGLVWWSPLFRLYVLAAGKGHKLQAGDYLLSPSMNMPKIAGKLASGDIATARITIPEGFTSTQISAKLQNVTRSVLVTLNDYEGYLFPDTYEIPYETDAEQIAKIMTDNFNKKTAGLKITPEIVIMASLLEKELKTKEDKEIVSGILWKRLRVGMPLQVDAFMWTYDNYGLPEKPISNPGIESILAALNPKESPYFYYLSTPDGKTIFSKTLEEHNTAKFKYLK